MESHSKNSRPASQRYLTLLWLAVWAAVVASAIYQFVEFNGRANLRCLGDVIIGCGLLSFTYKQQSIFASYPFSSLAVLGFSLTRLILPLVFISLEGKPLTYNLAVPVETFGWSLGLLALFLLAHLIHRTNVLTKRLRSWLTRRPLTFLGLFTPPLEIQIWLIGTLGLGAIIISRIFGSGFEDAGSNSVQSSPLVKFVEGLVPFTYLPFIAVFPGLYGGKAGNRIVGIIRPAIFVIALVVAATATNGRGLFMTAFLALGLAYLLGVLIGRIDLKITPAKVLILFLGLVVLNGPLKDLSSALIVARQYRSNVSPIKLIGITLEAYQNKNELKGSEEAEYGLGTETSFQYFDSPFLNRFCNIKFVDTSLDMEKQIARQIGEDRMHDEMWKVWHDHFLSTFPQPVMNLFGIHVDKKIATGGSFGDEMAIRATGDLEKFGGFFTGDLIGVDLATFGLWFLPVVFVLSMALFVLIDSLSASPLNNVKFLRNQKNEDPSLKSRHVLPILSPLGTMSVAIFFAMLTPETTEVWAAYLIRYWLQAVILYGIVFRLTRFRI